MYIVNKPFFQHPFTMLISGGTGTGKTEWLMRFLKNIEHMVQPNVRKILYCYGEANSNILTLSKNEMKNSDIIGNNNNGNLCQIKTHNGVPSEVLIREEALGCGGKMLLVLDDLIVNLDGAFLDSLFTRGSHNWGVSVILVTQHIFLKTLRTARANAHILCLMRNPAGELQIRTLAQQLFPGRHQFFMESYRDATREKFSYLLIDMHPNTDDRLRLRTNIFPDDNETIVYLSKS